MCFSIAATQAPKHQEAPNPRIVGLIETCEESGFYDVPPYIDILHSGLGDIELVMYLDSGAGSYGQLWLTTSLRGKAASVLKVEILAKDIRPGDASGFVP